MSKRIEKYTALAIQPHVKVANERAESFRVRGVLTKERDSRERNLGVKPPRVRVERRAGEPTEQQPRHGGAERRHRDALAAAMVTLNAEALGVFSTLEERTC